MLSNKNVEIDFFIPKARRAIQVSYSLADESTVRREMKALVKISDIYDIQNFEIITRDSEFISEQNGITIHIVPVWKWLLKEDD